MKKPAEKKVAKKGRPAKQAPAAAEESVAAAPHGVAEPARREAVIAHTPVAPVAGVAPVAPSAGGALKKELAQEKPKAKKIAEPKAKQEVTPIIAPAPAPVVEEKHYTSLELELPVTVKDLAVKIQEKPSILIKYLIEKQKMFVTINQNLNEDVVIKTLHDFGFEYLKKKTKEDLLIETHHIAEEGEKLLRPPVITFMGHVDHGKTSLLDAIRSSKVVDTEHGGITQHIGAYQVETPRGSITFLDTPGHEAFTTMRSRGANITDIVVLVVAADDGIMPQTVEAINHAKAANVPIVVAINKIDKQDIDIDKVKRQLAGQGLNPEDWGGQTITVGVSAKTGQGIDELLEMISLEAELLELKAAYNQPASGVVIEAKLSKGQGPVVTILVQNGTLKVGDNMICGLYYGKIRAMINDRGGRIEKVTPGFPAEILGFSGVPEAGEKFYVLSDEKMLKDIVDKRQAEERLRVLTAQPKHISLEELYAQIQQGEVKELNLVIKADVQGSLEAIKESLVKLETEEVKLKILHSGIGIINVSDVILAEASNAIIIGFHVSTDAKAKELADEKKVDIRTYRIIYELLGEIKAAMAGMLAPKLKKTFIGKAEVRKVFNLSKSGIVAGCFVTKGKIVRNVVMELSRNGAVVFEGKIAALKRFKDDVRDVAEGFECGISLEGFTDYLEGDVMTAYTIEKIARQL